MMTREEAIEVLSSYDVNGVWADVDGKPYNAEEQAEAFDMAIEALQAKPKTGKWIVKHGNYCGVELKEYYCDKCGTRGALRRVFSDPEPLPNFCGHCGADMRGSDDETHKEETR